MYYLSGLCHRWQEVSSGANVASDDTGVTVNVRVQQMNLNYTYFLIGFDNNDIQ